MNAHPNIDHIIDEAVALADLTGPQTGSAPAPRMSRPMAPADQPPVELEGEPDDDRSREELRAEWTRLNSQWWLIYHRQKRLREPLYPVVDAAVARIGAQLEGQVRLRASCWLKIYHALCEAVGEAALAQQGMAIREEQRAIRRRLQRRA
ncbi:hypothetical protein KHC28_03440 [Ancylobacter sonchi]|uniref:hypothetical protein n=1 Tax=Ancylobacter sonchi TaxID=1937790 RepID=UPI001BD63FF0|nr:hypothetical protein [Ancylobacter sonchi]MBS7532704.1 hypothetical protein [Ancylobacter sonchi]